MTFFRNIGIEAVIGGLAVAGVVFLILPEGRQFLSQIQSTIQQSLKGIIPNFGGYSGAFSASNLPYDPNNYYVAPRDTSIMP